ncbi:MAG: DUF4065 domain-containing protein [Tissierellia bacterium]|nr:DUF4065 domain-containing protein [Tissierellia bacterium]MDD4781148.1 DUF4065 domain-containing protein [Tissierellia bacterium]
MRDVYEYAKYFIKNKLDTNPNTYDGNMKLQKLLFFANMISLATYDKLLFEEPICAFKNGCVIEKIRLRYKSDYNSFYNDSLSFNPDFNIEEYDVLSDTVGIFGELSAKELSEINHSYDFWNKSYKNSVKLNGYRCKEDSIVDIDDMRTEIQKMKLILDAYHQNKIIDQNNEIVNGVKFYYDSKEVEITDELLDELYDFSLSADEDSYTLYIDNGKLVIY